MSLPPITLAVGQILHLNGYLLCDNNGVAGRMSCDLIEQSVFLSVLFIDFNGFIGNTYPLVPALATCEYTLAGFGVCNIAGTYTFDMIGFTTGVGQIGTVVDAQMSALILPGTVANHSPSI